MAYLGTKPQSGFISQEANQYFTGLTQNYIDLNQSISSLSSVIVLVNGVVQENSDLTLTSSTRITLGATLVSADKVTCIYVAKISSTQAPATGSVTSDMLSGSIANSKLSNSSITLNGSAVSLGGSATTPSGGLVKLLGGTASSSVNHDFQNFMDTTKYNTYLVNLTEISNGSGDNQRIDLQFIANTTVLSGAVYWGAVQGYRSGNSEYTDAYESGTRARLGVPLVLNDTMRGNNRFHINVDSSRAMGVNIFGNNWGYNSSFGDYVFTNFTSGYNTTDTVTGIRLFESGDNAITFDYEIYGILK